MHSDTLKIDFHVHSEYSHDSKVKIKELIDLWCSRSIVSIVCDHNTLKGAARFWHEFKDRDTGIEPVYAEEITTTEGEIIGIFLKEEIHPGHSASETIDEIHRQNGLVLIPHPFDRTRRRSIDPVVLDALIEHVDIIEGFNSRTIFQDDNQKAAQYGMSHKKPLVSGSDAHLHFEIGRAYTRIKPFENPGHLLKNLDAAVQVTKKSTPFVHLITKIDKAFR